MKILVTLNIDVAYKWDDNNEPLFFERSLVKLYAYMLPWCCFLSWLLSCCSIDGNALCSSWKSIWWFLSHVAAHSVARCRAFCHTSPRGDVRQFWWNRPLMSWSPSPLFLMLASSLEPSSCVDNLIGHLPPFGMLLWDWNFFSRKG